MDLMQAYARIRTKDEFRPFVVDQSRFLTLEQALSRMRPLIGLAGDWTELSTYLPEGWDAEPELLRSATAATFAASLELAREGRVEIRQARTYAPIQIRRRGSDG